jgi:hypothetical protein
LTYLKTNNRKKNKNNRENNSENKIVSIANKNFKTSFYINSPLRNPLNFQAEKKREEEKSKRIVDDANKRLFFSGKNAQR